MHLRTLLRELTDLYGQPADGQDGCTHRWEVMPPGRMNAIHLCVTMDDRAVVRWSGFFDPATKPIYLNLNGTSDIENVIATIRRCVPPEIDKVDARIRD